MVTFNNELETARRSILNWSEIDVLEKVTIVRDVFGKLSFLFDSTSFPDEQQRNDLELLLSRNLQGYYSGNTYCEKMPSKDKKYLVPVLDLMKEESSEWYTEHGIKFYLSERPIAKKAWVSRKTDIDAVWPYEDALRRDKPRVITFYSFKGGMGRTTALAGTALQLARKGKNVMMIDMDIEAPGLATLFFEEERIQNGVLDYLLEHPLSVQSDIADYVLDVTDSSLLEENDGSLFIIPAGKVDENYLQKLARIDYQDHREGALRTSLGTMLEELRSRFAVDYILIDARAGFHDMGGIAVAQLPHGAVLFGNSSRQSWDGITQVIRTIAESHSENIPIVIADCMCENSTSPSFLQAKDHFIQKAYTVCIENYYTENDMIPGINAENVAHSPVFLPYDASLRQDITLYSTGSAEEDARVRAFTERLTSDVYKVIVDRIQSWFGEGDIV